VLDEGRVCRAVEERRGSRVLSEYSILQLRRAHGPSMAEKSSGASARCAVQPRRRNGTALQRSFRMLQMPRCIAPRCNRLRQMKPGGVMIEILVPLLPFLVPLLPFLVPLLRCLVPLRDATIPPASRSSACRNEAESFSASEMCIISNGINSTSPS
jgi:hypothetical protein